VAVLEQEEESDADTLKVKDNTQNAALYKITQD
jgi:hypothetical protein